MLPVEVVAIAVEQVESGGRWWVENRGCVGVMQVNPRWSIHTRADLLDPEVNRQEGRRMLGYWLTRAHGEWHKALAGYNCGNAGLRGECGRGYANRVWRLVKQLDRAGGETMSNEQNNRMREAISALRRYWHAGQCGIWDYTRCTCGADEANAVLEQARRAAGLEDKP